jgi:O-antigen/teichoic acid export membrane protein
LLSTLLARLGLHRGEHVSVARDFSVYSSISLVSQVVLQVTNLWARRYLGPYAAGIWTALDLLPGYAAYAHLGILNAAERELPFLLGANRVRDFDALKNTLRWLTHGLGLGLAVALVIGAVTWRGRLPRTTFIGLLVYAPCLWTQLISTYYVALYRARKRFVTLSRRQGTANIAKGVLLLSGESDPFARIELLRTAIGLLDRAELVTYPRLGHTLKPVLEDALDRAAAFLLKVPKA